MPSAIQQWQQARADLSHDWLERGLLARLETLPTDDITAIRQAKTCLEWWTNSVEPLLLRVLDEVPIGFMPRSLLGSWFDDSALLAIDSAATQKWLDAVPGVEAFKATIEEIRVHAFTSLSALADRADEPTRERAMRAVLALRGVIRSLPRGVALP